MVVLKNSIINFFSVYCGILTTGEFTGDTIHCKLQLLLDNLYFALCQSVVW